MSGSVKGERKMGHGAHSAVGAMCFGSWTAFCVCDIAQQGKNKRGAKCGAGLDRHEPACSKMGRGTGDTRNSGLSSVVEPVDLEWRIGLSIPVLMSLSTSYRNVLSTLGVVAVNAGSLCTWKAEEED